MPGNDGVTDQFYAWEHRGRGWKCWSYPVEIEPPFSPFRYHGGGSARFPHDDGRKTTPFSRMGERILALIGAGAEANGSALQVLEIDDVTASPAREAGQLVELRIALPPEASVQLEACEQFLLAIPRTPEPIAFEVVGTSESVAVQLVCGIGARANLLQLIRGFFPEATVTLGEGELARGWMHGPGHSVVVDFGLSDEFMLPLRPLRRLDVDPLIGLAAALSDLGVDECGAFQVLFQPVEHPWAENILRAVLDDEGSPFFLDAPDVTSLARDKVARPLFSAVIRVAGRAGTYERAFHIARSLGWGLNVLSNPPANRLIPLSNDGYRDDLHETDLLERRTCRSGMILSSIELASLVHPPSASVRSEKLVRSGRRSRAAPPVARAGELSLGINRHLGAEAEVRLSTEQRLRHLYVIGASGTGKSTLLLNLILQDLEAGHGLALLDPHGDLVDEVMRHCPPGRIKDVVLIDPADAEYPIGFNILSAHSELERTLISSDLVSVFRRLATSWGDQMTAVLGNAILAILESHQGGTLFDLRRFLVEPLFRRDFLRGVKDPEVVYFWEKEFPLLAGKPQAPLLTRLNTFLRPRAIRYMVAQRESRLDLRQTMDRGGVVLARLSQGAIGEENAFLLGTLLVSKLHQIAISRQDIAASERRPFYLYMDEFQNFVTPSMEAILSGARKYGLGLVLAHQDLRQIQSRSPDVFNSVLSNPYTRVCFRVGDHDARVLASGFSHFDERDLQSLSTGEAIVRVERAEFDFTLHTRHVPEPDPASAAVRDEIVRGTRERFASAREAVEAGMGVQTTIPSDVAVDPEPGSGAERAAVLPAPAPTSSAEVKNKPRPSAPTPGRGGKQHTYLQDLIARWGEANGWRASIEEPVLDGLGCVDVALRLGDVSVGCEVMVTSPVEHEVANLQKCLSAGFNAAVSVSADARQLAKLRKLAGGSLDGAALARTHFVTPEQLFELLPELGAGPRRETTVRGYRVKVRTSGGASNDARETRNAVTAVLARALKRLGK